MCQTRRKIQFFSFPCTTTRSFMCTLILQVSSVPVSISCYTNERNFLNTSSENMCVRLLLQPYRSASRQKVKRLISKHNIKMNRDLTWALRIRVRQPCGLTLILRRSRTGTVWFYTSTSNKRAAWPKLYTKSLTRDLKRMYSRLTLVRISIKL